MQFNSENSRSVLFKEESSGRAMTVQVLSRDGCPDASGCHEPYESSHRPFLRKAVGLQHGIEAFSVLL